VYVTFSDGKGVFDVFDRLKIERSSSNSDPGVTYADDHVQLSSKM
jgi:hypothetical protein